MASVNPVEGEEGKGPRARLLALDFIPTFTALARAKEEFTQCPPITSFEFSNITLCENGHNILTNCFGGNSADGKEILAIFGPSATAQTKLLQILAGKQHVVKRLAPGSRLTCNAAGGQKDYFSMLRAGLVLAEPKHLLTSTVEEELWFACALSLPLPTAVVNKERRRDLVDEMMRALNLESKAKTQIQYLSKAELKRVAAGVELFALPNVLFVDQPTMGNRKEDWELVQILQQIQRLGLCQVVCAVFVPRDEVFQALSQHFVLLGNAGETLVMGNAAQAERFFIERGITNKDQLSLGDFFLLSAQYELVLPPPPVSASELQVAAAPATKPARFRPRQSLPFQFTLLFKREIFYVVRTPGKLANRIATAAFVLALCALLFPGAGDQSRPAYTAATHFGSFVFPVISLTINSALGTAEMSHEFKQVIMREQRVGMFSLAPAMLAKLLTEVVLNYAIVLEGMAILHAPIGWGGSLWTLSAVFFLMSEAMTSNGYLFGFACQDATTAVGLSLFSILPQILFFGSFARLNVMPTWLVWINWICSLTYGVKALTAIEFAPENCATTAICAQRQVVLDSNFVHTDDLPYFFLALALFTLVFRILAYSLYFRAYAKQN